MVTSITAPRSGFLFIVASFEAFNTTELDTFQCAIELNDADVVSSRRAVQIDGNSAGDVNEEENCHSNAVVPVTAGTYKVELESGDLVAGTQVTTADLGAIFIPFNATGA